MFQISRYLEKFYGTFKAATQLAKPNFKNGFQINGVDFDGDESGYLSGITPGTVTASKALVVDANKDLASLRNVTMTGVLVGGSAGLGNSVVYAGLATGTAGTIRVFPGTASKGKLDIKQAANTGDTDNTITVAAQAGARDIGIPDWSTKASSDAEVSLAGIKVVADTTSRPGALGCLLYATGNNKLYVCTAASATAATWTIVGTQS